MLSKMKLARMRKGLRQKTLASLVGVSRSYIASIENGIYKPDIEVWQRIAKALGTTVKEIIE